MPTVANRNAIRTHEQPPPPAPNGSGEGERVLPPLPERRAKLVEYGLAEFQHVAAERDELHREVAALRTDAAGHQVEMEAMRSRLADMESRVQTAVLVRDQAVAERAVYETLFISMQAQLRAFKVPAAPLVTGEDTEG